MKEFVHLHLHSDYSALDGACQFDALFARMAEIGQTAVALTDHGFMGGIMDFQSQARHKNVKPIIGCEIYLTLEESNRTKAGEIYHMGLLCQNMEGYRNLTKLVSDAHVSGTYYGKPRADLAALAKHSKGLIGFTGCLAGAVPQLLLKGEYDKAREMTAKFCEIFGSDRYFVELQNHGIPEQHQIFKDLFRLAKEFNLRPVATNDVHYVRQEHYKPHDALLCIGTGKHLDDPKRPQYKKGTFYLMSGDEMAERFPEVPEALTNTIHVAEMCDLKIKTGGNHYPVFPLPQGYQGDAASYVRHLCIEALPARYAICYDEAVKSLDPAKAELAKRMDYELSIIAKTGFSDYFLIVWDFIKWAKDRRISVGAGRGSGAGSMVAYLLRITDIEPLRYGLLFERFLNPERVSPPDFDIDFCMLRRGEVIEYVRQKYGKENVSNIITYGTLGAKTLFRDLARVHGLPYSAGDKLAKMVPDEVGVTLKSALHRSAELRAACKNPMADEIVAEAQVLEGMVRSTGQHAAGIVIAPSDISDFLPVTVADGALCTQYDMGWVEKLGLLKMDFLGLRTLTVIAEAESHIRRTSKPDFAIETIPLDDAKTFDLLNQGNSTSVFQMESGGIRSLARQLHISSIEEIFALVALYRPGPMDLIPDFIRGKKDPSTVKYPHPLLENVCKETYGVMVYQEQVMEAARVLAGYTLGGADMLRRAMGKKVKEEMEKQRRIFVEGCAKANNIERPTAEAIFALLEKFAGYGFNKSHSAAYGLITYRTAYLKANYPVQFMAAMLTSNLGKADELAAIIEEATRMGIQVLGPDIRESLAAFTPIPDSNSILFGLAGVKGVGEIAAAEILAARQERGQPQSLEEFLEHTATLNVNRRAIENLIKTGAFDRMHKSRSGLLSRLEAAMEQAHQNANEKVSGQESFLDLLGSEATTSKAPDDSGPPLSLADTLAYERELLGYYLSGHPLDRYKPLDTLIDTLPLVSLKEAPGNSAYRLCGVILDVERRISKKDNRTWCTFNLATREGNIELSLFSRAYQSFSQHVVPGKLVLIMGSVLRNIDDARFTVEEMYSLDAAVPSLVQTVTWRLRADHPDLPAFLKRLRTEIDAGGSGITRTSFQLEVGSNYLVEAVASQSLEWRFSIDTFKDLASHPAVIATDFQIKEMRFRPRGRMAA